MDGWPLPENDQLHWVVFFHPPYYLSYCVQSVLCVERFYKPGNHLSYCVQSVLCVECFYESDNHLCYCIQSVLCEEHFYESDNHYIVAQISTEVDISS